MRFILVIAAFLSFTSFSQDFDFFQKSDDFFAKHVEQGRVDY